MKKMRDSTLGTSTTAALTVEIENSQATRVFAEYGPRTTTGFTVWAKSKEWDTG